MHSITIISATNRVDSNTEKVANYYKSALKSKGVDVELFSLKDLPESVLHTDLYGKRLPPNQIAIAMPVIMHSA